MIYDIPEEQRKSAKLPHEIFLINLITNHILVFVGLLGMAKSFPLGMLVTPTISLCILTYLLYGARRARLTQPWFVACHWALCARRSKLFIGMLGILGLVVVGLVLSVGGSVENLRPGHYALGGAAMLPTLVTILVLIVMESDAVHKARIGELPDWLTQKFPNPEVKPVA